jgi:hypothetical protein
MTGRRTPAHRSNPTATVGGHRPMVVALSTVRPSSIRVSRPFAGWTTPGPHGLSTTTMSHHEDGGLPAAQGAELMNRRQWSTPAELGRRSLSGSRPCTPPADAVPARATCHQRSSAPSTPPQPPRHDQRTGRLRRTGSGGARSARDRSGRDEHRCVIPAGPRGRGSIAAAGRQA